jgi:ferredoxin
MKIQSLKLVYFSPTGTTRRIIEVIACGIKKGAVSIVDITRPEARQQQLQTSEDELLVVGVPVYAGRVPAIAIDWLHMIKARNTPTVCIVVYGNREYDDALLELKDTVVKQGCIPIACAAYIGEHSFSNSETPIAVARPDATDLNLAEIFGQKINEKLLSISVDDQISNITVPGNYPYKDYKDPKAFMTPVDFISISDKCSQCGVCAKVCPVGAIDLENSALIDKEKCIVCCACIKGCPENALTIKAVPVKDIAMRLSQTCQKRKEPEFFF